MNDPDDIALQVIRDLEARRLQGIAQYGKPVRADDASEDWLQHWYFELLDAAIYCKAEIERRKRATP